MFFLKAVATSIQHLLSKEISTMWDFILQIVNFLIAAGIIGALVTYMVLKILGNKKSSRVRRELETKILRLKGDLEKTSDELKSHRDRLESLKVELGESANLLKARDAQLKGLEARIVTYETTEAELEAKKSELVSINNEMNSMRTKLLDTEAELKRTNKPEAKLGEEINSLKKNLAGKNNEITLLLNRVKELAPLTLQIRDRELRIRELEKKHADELTTKDTALANLSARIGELEVKLQSTETNFEESTTRLHEADRGSPAQGSTAEAETEIALLKRRIKDLETMHILAVHPPPKDKWDDLIAITGMGPSVVKLLHRLGIYNFKQVAILDDEQIDWVDSQLERFHGRIRREHWVESAKNEHYKKYGERL